MKKYINAIIKGICFLSLDLMTIQGESKNEIEIKKIDKYISELEIVIKSVTQDYVDLEISAKNYRIVLAMCEGLRKFALSLKETY